MLRAQEVGFGEDLPIFRGFFGEVGVKRSKFRLIFGDSFLNEKVGEFDGVFRFYEYIIVYHSIDIS